MLPLCELVFADLPEQEVATLNDDVEIVEIIIVRDHLPPDELLLPDLPLPEKRVHLQTKPLDLAPAPSTVRLVVPTNKDIHADYSLPSRRVPYLLMKSKTAREGGLAKLFRER
jgi:hypothetical protein